MKAIFFGTLLVLGLPLTTHAALYNYVDVEGDIEVVTADSWIEALSSAPHIHPHSGVALVLGGEEMGGTVEGSTMSSRTYQYVTIEGEIRSVSAPSADEALVRAEDRAQRSGVALVVDEPIPADEEVQL